MAEELTLAGGSKADRYAALLPQIEAVMQDESDLIANMANVASMLWETFAPSAFPLRQTAYEASVQSPAHSSFSWMWVGFYRVMGSELCLARFRGQWHAPASATDVVCAVQHGRRDAHRWCLMWNSFPAISPAPAPHAAR